jgi:hypothetical protein
MRVARPHRAGAFARPVDPAHRRIAALETERAACHIGGVITNLNRSNLLFSIVGVPLTVVGLAVLLFASSASNAAEPSDPISQSEINFQGAHCRNSQYMLRHWFDLYCACIGRTASHQFTAKQFRGITREPITGQLLEQLGIDRAKLDQMIASCQREAEPARSTLPGAGGQTTTDAAPPTSDDIKARGRTLRAKLNEVYNSGAHSNPFDVTDIVVPYIPIGTSFQDAEALLRAAGFTVGAHPNLSESLNINRSFNWYAVLAKIQSFHSGGFMRTDLYVTLEPDVPGHYTTVSRLSAEFWTSWP